MGLIPWGMKLVSSIHQLDHADFIWLLLAIPSRVILWPDMIFEFEHSAGGWYPMDLVAVASGLNFLIVFIAASLWELGLRDKNSKGFS